MMGSVGVALLLMAAPLHAAEPSVALSLVIPSRDGVARVLVSDPKSHFHVILSNESAAPQRIWDATFSWGYYALSFELQDDSGTMHVVRKRKVGFTRNMPATWLLMSKEPLVLDVFLGDPRVWVDLPDPPSGCRAAQLQAVFEVAADEESQKQGAWTGRVVSNTRPVSLCK